MNDENLDAFHRERTTVHNWLNCPVCSAGMDAATCISEQAAKPKNGDFSLCTRCASVLVFQISAVGVVALREPTLAELRVWATDRRAVTVARALASEVARRLRG